MNRKKIAITKMDEYKEFIDLAKSRGERIMVGSELNWGWNNKHYIVSFNEKIEAWHVVSHNISYSKMTFDEYKNQFN